MPQNAGASNDDSKQTFSSVFDASSGETHDVSAHCASCKKSDIKLLRCSRCQIVHYCSKDCQKTHWPTHKKACGVFASAKNGNTTDSKSKSSKATSKSSPLDTMKGLGLGGDKWLHDRPEAEVYTLLIDSYKLRMEDEMNFRGDIDEDYFGGTVASAAKSLNRFLRKAEKRDGILPPWWQEEKLEACIKQIEKSDIIEHYGNPMMPMQLRMLAEEITGSYVMAIA